MSRTTSIFSVSLPPEMLAELERARKVESRTRSELIREALRRYFRVDAFRRSTGQDVCETSIIRRPWPQRRSSRPSPYISDTMG
ncbi:CopG family ribbon-helix-helix protein [Bradyrhizobium sp. CCGB20]|uniref:CopG family ribbon-helix-helix protein n=1 Tax=unclassified Bradyrhizobium TaxID=2631580 RepID=UPI0035C7600E